MKFNLILAACLGLCGLSGVAQAADALEGAWLLTSSGGAIGSNDTPDVSVKIDEYISFQSGLMTNLDAVGINAMVEPITRSVGVPYLVVSNDIAQITDRDFNGVLGPIKLHYQVSANDLTLCAEWIAPVGQILCDSPEQFGHYVRAEQPVFRTGTHDVPKLTASFSAILDTLPEQDGQFTDAELSRLLPKDFQYPVNPYAGKRIELGNIAGWTYHAYIKIVMNGLDETSADSYSVSYSLFRSNADSASPSLVAASPMSAIVLDENLDFQMTTPDGLNFDIVTRFESAP